MSESWAPGTLAVAFDVEIEAAGAVFIAILLLSVTLAALDAFGVAIGSLSPAGIPFADTEVDVSSRSTSFWSIFPCSRRRFS